MDLLWRLKRFPPNPLIEELSLWRISGGRDRAGHRRERRGPRCKDAVRSSEASCAGIGLASSTDAAHGARGGDEIGFADVVASFFAPDNPLQPFANRLVGRAAAQQGAKIVFGDAEE